MLERWDEVDWKIIREQGLPPLDRAWFEALVSPKTTPAKAQNALRFITVAVFDQACVVPHTSALAVGLFGDALREGCRAPVDVLHLIGDMAGASARFDALDGFDRNDPEWKPLLDDPASRAVIEAVESLFDQLVPLLGDKNAKVRAAAAYAIAFIAPRAEDALAALRTRLAKEKDDGAAASMVLALANHLGYAKEKTDELGRWIDDERPLVSAAAAIAGARRLDPGPRLTSASRVLLDIAGRIVRAAPADPLPAGPSPAKKKAAKKKASEASPAPAPFPVPAFRFGGGNVEALALASLARLGPRDPAIAKRLLELLDDETPLGGNDWFATRTTARVVAAAIGATFPQRKVAAPSELDPGARAMLEAFATRPWAWSGALRMPPGVPGPRLPLARWLGLRPSREELYGRRSGERPIGDAIRRALDDSGPLEPVIASLSEAVSGEDALDVVQDLCTVTTDVKSLPWWFEPAHHDGSAAQIRQWGAEGGRRSTRQLLIAYGLLRARGAELEPHLRRTVRGIVGHGNPLHEQGMVGALAWAALDALSGGKEPLPDGFWSSAKHVMGTLELVPVFGAALERMPVRERVVALQLFSVQMGIRSHAWLYADRLPLSAIPALVKAYSMRPDDTIFPAVLERMRAEGLNEELDQVLAWGIERFGTEPRDHWSNPEGLHAKTFRDSSGKEITLWVEPTPVSRADVAPSWSRAQPR